MKKMGVWRAVRSFYRSCISIDWPHRLLEKLAREHANVKFVLIGANDGITNDYLHPYILKHLWAGIMVEPVPYLYEQLQKNYSGYSNLYFENVAISSQNGIQKFYAMINSDDQSLPDWYNNLSSFRKDVILSHSEFIPNIEKYIEEIDIQTVTLKFLLQKHQINNINLLVIDTEGFDLEILKMIDFNVIQPDLIIFEIKHLTQMERKEAIALLEQYHYTIYKNAEDYSAYKRRVRGNT